MQKKKTTFRVGKVQAYRRGDVWYLCYYENGKRRRPRVGPSKDEAEQLAAQINGQIQIGAPAALSFENITIPELRQRWLDHHETVLRSSVKTIARYRTTTEHLLRFLHSRPVRNAAQFGPNHGEAFIRYLRGLEVSPNGHSNTPKRPLLDKGLRFILECCRSLFNFAAKRRHLPPYAENPFNSLEIDRIPVEQFRPVDLFAPHQEEQFFHSCDDWQFPLFLTLALTGMRPGELSHLLLPEDLDLKNGMLFVRNKPKLGWQTKTRNEREIPLIGTLKEVLEIHLGGRMTGPLFVRRTRRSLAKSHWTPNRASIESELEKEIQETLGKDRANREQKLRIAKSFWRKLGAPREERVRLEFMKITRSIGLAQSTAPKMFRHLFATTLQEGRVDPLIRNELMGHVGSGQKTAGYGLAMTAVYTHTRPETRRSQLEEAMKDRSAVRVAQIWLEKKRSEKGENQPRGA